MNFKKFLIGILIFYFLSDNIKKKLLDILKILK